MSPKPLNLISSSAIKKPSFDFFNIFTTPYHKIAYDLINIQNVNIVYDPYPKLIGLADENTYKLLIEAENKKISLFLFDVVIPP